MPLLSGLEVARRIAGRCHVVFITSYDQHALEAFEAGAVDYVLKPPTAPRLLTTLERVKARLQQPPADLRARWAPTGAPQSRRATCSGSTPRAAQRAPDHGGGDPVLQVGPEVHAGGHPGRRR